MKKSKTYYDEFLRKLIIAGSKASDFKFPVMERSKAILCLAEYDRVLENMWLSHGDTKFNKMGYTNSSTKLLEHLEKIS